MTTPGSPGENALELYEDAVEARSYFYVPLRADLQRAPDGTPAVSLIRVADGGYLSLTAEWNVSPAELARLRQRLADRDGIADPRLVRVAFAPLEGEICRLFLRDETSGTQLLATSTTSRIPPYAALFNLRLSPGELSRALQALQGAEEVLFVEYEGWLTSPLKGGAVRARLDLAKVSSPELIKSIIHTGAQNAAD